MRASIYLNITFCRTSRSEEVDLRSSERTINIVTVVDSLSSAIDEAKYIKLCDKHIYSQITANILFWIGKTWYRRLRALGISRRAENFAFRDAKSDD